MTNFCIIILLFFFIFVYILIYKKEKKFLISFSQSVLYVAIIFYFLCVLNGCFVNVKEVKKYNLANINYTIDKRFINIDDEKIYIKDIIFKDNGPLLFQKITLKGFFLKETSYGFLVISIDSADDKILKELAPKDS